MEQIMERRHVLGTALFISLVVFITIYRVGLMGTRTGDSFTPVITTTEDCISPEQLGDGVPKDLAKSDIKICSPTDRLSAKDKLYSDRLNVVKQGCRKLNRPLSNVPPLRAFLIERKHDIAYCPIAKVASTFWKSVLTVMGSKHPDQMYVFNLTLSDVNLDKYTDLTFKEIERLHEHGTTMMFIRDPYARLFSAYVNKLYHSNLLYWKRIGRKAVYVTRNTTDTRYTNYGFDLTFAEFVKYLLFLKDNDRQIERHFAPMHSRCDPCKHKFHFIGKLETLKADFDYLLAKWRSRYPDITFKFTDFEKESAVRTASGHIRFLYKTKRVLDEIKFPFQKLMLRTWRDLQIRGYIDKSIEFPFKHTLDVANITELDFLGAIEEALSVTLNRTAVKLQREEALLQAYNSVPMSDMERLREYVMQDCLLFGYDDRPAKLFSERKSPINDDFLYLDGITV